MGIEAKISEVIIKRYLEALKEHLLLDVVVVGGGPSGLVCAYYLARGGVKAAVIESKYSPGGGIWGGGMGFSVAVLQSSLKPLLEEFNIIYEEEEDNLLTVDAVLLGGCLVERASRYARVFNGVTCEDIIVKKGKICGVVVNSSAIRTGGFHIDPLNIESKVVVDATGHDAVVSRLAERHLGKKILPQGPMSAEEGEKFTVEHTGELVKGLYVCGMAVGAVFGGPRMGPIFGGMLQSGKRCAELILEQLYK
ncbi:MAG: sulfide-dependent adenosine diphosphate thiazole synthase [Planctomycetota bacterium]|nr:sulfide-dependent adenosine diphosphate thiazole synthase [Planctomycetota bacterium]